MTTKQLLDAARAITKNPRDWAMTGTGGDEEKVAGLVGA